MNEAEFRAQALANGFGDLQAKAYAPQTDGPFHTHDFAVMLWVVSGEFSLALQDKVRTFRPGECCELAAHVLHTERAGADGAQVLLGKRPAVA